MTHVDLLVKLKIVVESTGARGRTTLENHKHSQLIVAAVAQKTSNKSANGSALLKKQRQNGIAASHKSSNQLVLVMIVRRRIPAMAHLNQFIRIRIRQALDKQQWLVR